MADDDWPRVLQGPRKVPQQCKSRKLGPMTVSVVRPPGRVDCMAILVGDEWRQQRVTMIDAGIEQGDVNIGILRRSQSFLQVGKPLRLLFMCQFGEELGGRLGTAQFRQHVEYQRRMQKLLPAGLDLDHRALREMQNLLANHQACHFADCSEIVDDLESMLPGGEPRLPPNHVLHSSWKRLRGVRPE